MRVLYYHQYFKTRQGSGGGRSYELAKRLIQNGHEVTIVCGRNLKENLKVDGQFKKRIKRGNIDGISIIQIDVLVSNKYSFLKRSIRFLQFSLKSIKLVFSEDYDILFATSTPLTIGIPGLALKLLKPRTNKMFVFEVRDLWPDLPIAMGIIKKPVFKKLLGYLEYKIYKVSDGIIGLSPGMVDGIKKKVAGEKKITMIPNASDIDLFKPGSGNKTIIEGCAKTDTIAVFTGTHGIANGLDYVLDVCEILKNKNIRDIKILLIGDGSEKTRLIEKSKRLKLSNCLFLEPIPKNELPKIMDICDIGMMILDNIPEFAYGTSPNKFFDYLACGLPVIVNHYGWISDIIASENCGLTASPNEPETFANHLLRLRDDKDLMNVMSLNSRKVAENKFNRNKLAMEFEDFLLHVLND